MILLLPFVNALILYVILVKGQPLNKAYDFFMNKISPRLPIPNKLLGVCIVCTSFTMLGIPEIIGYVLLTNKALSGLVIAKLFVINCFNAITTTILFKWTVR